MSTVRIKNKMKEDALMKRALLVIDVQNEYFTEKKLVTYPEGSLNNILKAIDAAGQRQIPVIVIQHSSLAPGAKTFVKGSPTWEIHPKVQAKGHQYLVEKNLPGSFTGTELDAILKQEAVDTVVISGYMTQMCCDTTARQAFHMGYQVEFLSDATGTLDISNNAGSVKAEELHRAILVTQVMFSRILTTEEWISGL